MAVETTSKIAYLEINTDGTARTQKKVILEAVRHHYELHGEGMSLKEIVLLTGYEINAVSGRVNDLKKLKLLETIEKRKCSVTGRLIAPVVPILRLNFI
ncbi:hypothetical protein CMI47_18030 [Candidatus Pacearchaeota archaeon]|nr:hypothetical protein [Candidatus Pacearchaeota archaeon]|tara:strand:+ start:2397 stop:2693 length:297 start_codon:yes stop_codon:yes gene_type:complete